MLNEDKVIRMWDAAEYLGISRQTLKRWCNKGLVKHVRMGPRKDRYFKVGDLIALREVK